MKWKREYLHDDSDGGTQKKASVFIIFSPTMIGILVIHYLLISFHVQKSLWTFMEKVLQNVAITHIDMA